MKPPGYGPRVFSPWFDLPGLHFGYLLLTHSHLFDPNFCHETKERSWAPLLFELWLFVRAQDSVFGGMVPLSLLGEGVPSCAHGPSP